MNGCSVEDHHRWAGACEGGEGPRTKPFCPCLSATPKLRPLSLFSFQISWSPGATAPWPHPFTRPCRWEAKRKQKVRRRIEMDWSRKPIGPLGFQLRKNSKKNQPPLERTVPRTILRCRIDRPSPFSLHVQMTSPSAHRRSLFPIGGNLQ